MIELKNVSKFYYSKGVVATGFTKVNASFRIGEFIAITGESGSGKSTLLNVISGLDTYEEGEMYVEGKETSHYLEKDWEIYRRKYIGNIYQNFNLINSYTVYQNIDMILSLNGVPRKERKLKINELLKKVNMLSYKRTKVSKLSGGQKQRVAIARALAKDVPVIIADEPTGNLDKASAESIIELLREISKNKLIIIVTHNYEQVEKYVTRKITMHDGKILEDKKINPVEESNISLNKYQFKDMNGIEKIRIGFRNTFNIIPKFLLLLAVYSFIVCALMSEYSFFKEGEYETSKIGYTFAFQDTEDHRIVLNKKDKTSFTTEELEKIEKMNNVDYVVENDITLDQNFEFVSKNERTWISGLLRPIDRLNKKDIIGELPKEENEILIEAEEDNYMFNDAEEIIGEELYLFDNHIGEINKEKAYVVTGVRYRKPEEAYMDQAKIYVQESFLDSIQYATHQIYSSVSIDFINEIVDSYTYTSYMQLEPNHWVPQGTVFVSEDENYRCEKDNCVGKNITVNVKNAYYQDSITLKIEKTYNKKNIMYVLDLPNYNKDEYDYRYNGLIFINPDDYNNLFNKGTYQISVFVKNINKIDDTVNELNSNYNTFVIKNTLVTDSYSRIIRVLKIFVTVVLVVVLFFISYFIIRIILKSRNIYFSILRMLGASKKVCLDLLITELLVVSNISYFIFLLIAELNRRKYFHIGFINTVNTYFHRNDYIVLYIIITLMSLLISLRYSRKLFKNSVMNTYREE